MNELDTAKLKSLQDIFDEDDEFGLLAVKPQVNQAQNADARLMESFAQINAFYSEHKREPSPQNGMDERMLFSRLQGLRDDANKVLQLKNYDCYGLLGDAPVPLESLADIFADDDLSLLDGDNGDGDLFNLQHVQLSDLQRAESDFVARRKPCKNFDAYEAQFKAVQTDLLKGQRKLLPFTDSNLLEGCFYVNNGMILLLEKIEFETENITLNSGKRIRKDGRTRCVFENGTESNMLFRSLSKILYANGQVVTIHSDETDAALANNFGMTVDDDQATGYIYILKSKSENNTIKQIKNLYKIGYSTIDVETRIKNAEDEPTYLMAQVDVIAVYECYNLNPQKFEQLLHGFFGKACLNVEIFDGAGKAHKPREWFIAPFNIVEHAIKLIISSEITHYYYDDLAEAITIRR
jgi:hypothetical protein